MLLSFALILFLSRCEPNTAMGVCKCVCFYFYAWAPVDVRERERPAQHQNECKLWDTTEQAIFLHANANDHIQIQVLTDLNTHAHTHSLADCMCECVCVSFAPAPAQHARCAYTHRLSITALSIWYSSSKLRTKAKFTLEFVQLFLHEISSRIKFSKR